MDDLTFTLNDYFVAVSIFFVCFYCQHWIFLIIFKVRSNDMLIDMDNCFHIIFDDCRES